MASEKRSRSKSSSAAGSDHIDIGLLVGRLGIGAIFATFGWQKLVGGQNLWIHLGEAMGRLASLVPPMVWGLAATFTEFLGGILLMIGLLFRPVCLLLMFVMVVAFVSVFRPDRDFNTWSRPIEMFCILLVFLLIGPGRFRLGK